MKHHLSIASFEQPIVRTSQILDQFIARIRDYVPYMQEVSKPADEVPVHAEPKILLCAALRNTSSKSPRTRFTMVA